MEENRKPSSDEELWRILAWALSLLGALLAILLGPNTKSVRYWAFMSIAFFIVSLVASVAATLLSLIPFVGGFFSLMVGVALLIVWVIGLVKAINNEEWKPPVIYDLAVKLGGPELEQ